MNPLSSPAPLERADFDAAELVRAHPPHWFHPNKAVVYDIATSTGDPFRGSIRYARWVAVDVPPTLPDASGFEFEIRAGHYDYAPDLGERVDWHVNFADPHLFGMYDSALFAQDEIQVAEHPILGSLREALVAAGRDGAGPRTVDGAGRPTPVTVSGAERRCAIDAAEIYGNAFAHASEAEVRAACWPISPPTVTNILAMAAPRPGRGIYSRDEIDYVVECAFAGFLAARAESESITDSGDSNPIGVLVHTGFWGCGAFGGNRTLMTMLQALAADLAGVDIAFHAFDAQGRETAGQAIERYRKLCEGQTGTTTLLHAFESERFTWGVSDGN